jgi:hypothetical protein
MLTYALTDVQCHIENTLKHITGQCFVRLNVGDLPQQGISKPKLRHLVTRPHITVATSKHTHTL